MLSDDCFLQLASWCETARDVVHVWIALCLSKRGMGVTSHVWQLYLKGHYERLQGDDLEGAMMRAGMRLDEQEDPAGGLRLVERLYSVRKCGRSGCLERYREINNVSGCCQFHPGRLRNGALTCCKAKFSSTGCKRGWHDGSLYESIYSARSSADAPAPASLLPPAAGATPMLASLSASAQPSKSSSVTLKLPKI